MNTTIKVILGKDLAKAVKKTTKEFGYTSEEEFVIDAIRRRLKESKINRKTASAWHSLLSTHLSTNEMKDTERYSYRPRFGLKDLQKKDIIGEI